MKGFGSILLLASAAVAAQQPAAAVGDRAVVELRCDSPRAFVGQALDLTVVVRIEHRLWREHLIQLFRQETDLAVRLRTPWAEALDGFESLGTRPPGAAGAVATAVVDGAVVPLRRLGDETRGGETFARFELVHRLVPKRAGTLAIRPATLQFAWAARFVEDFFGERVPQGREDVSLTSLSATIDVTELPARGRPAAFTGLVGRVTLQAGLDAAPAVRVGDAVSFRLSVSGDGDLRPFRAPLLADLPGFWVRGVREETESGRRSAIYELVARRVGSHSIPRIDVPFFSPATATYEVASSPPIGVAVAPGPDGATSLDDAGGAGEAGAGGGAGSRSGGAAAGDARESAPVPGVDVLFGPLPVRRLDVPGPAPTFATAPAPTPVAILAWLLAPWLAVALFAGLRQRSRTRSERQRRRRRNAALRTLQRELSAPRRDRAAALVTFLATWLDCADAAVVGPDLVRRLCAIGVEVGLASRFDAMLDAVVAPRFGAAIVPPSDADVLGLATAVDRQVRRHERQQRAQPPAAVAALAIALAGGAVCAQQGASAPAAGDAPTEARRLLDAGDPARASELYRSALDAGAHDPVALCFALATCAHRLGRPAESVLWYERALAVDPTHFESRANLRLVQQQLGLVDRGQRALARIAIESALATVAALGREVAFVLGGVLQVGGALLFWLRRRRGGGAFLAALGLAVALAAAAHALAGASEPAVVLRDGVRLLAEPHERAGAIGALLPGQVVDVLERSPRWARVREGASVGWVDASAFERVALR